jgi:acetoin utilization deacetylase AcuC-like enzyme
MSTGYVFHEKLLWHDTGTYAYTMPPGGLVEPYRHIENADSKRRFHSLVAASGLLDHLTRIAPREATDEEIGRIHPKSHIDKIKALSAAGGGDAGLNARLGPDGWRIVALSAGAAIAAVEAVLGGRVRNAYALTRPPGHHAEPEQAMGFCLIANAPIAVEHARATRGLGRVAFVDWDVHHGNGTETIYFEDPNVLTISLHQDRLFPPGRGGAEAIGRGAGEGYNVNIPLPAGCGEGAYLYAVERIVLPSLEAFGPELIVVPSGFDAGIFDPLGRMMLHGGSYRALTRLIKQAAEALCDGRLALMHEGGYCPVTVPFFGAAVIEELAGVSLGIDYPQRERQAAMPDQALQQHQKAAIDAVAEMHAAVRARCWGARRRSAVRTG